MTKDKPATLVIHGWAVFAHPLFFAQLEVLANQVKAFKEKDLRSENYNILAIHSPT